jgi:putative hydrolases of HD superfamily
MGSDDAGDQLAGAARFLFEAGLLKRAARTGWWVAGLTDPESIAEHSFRTALVGTVLAAMEGADPGRTAMLCVLHDTQETRVGDIAHHSRPYVTASANEAVTADQVAGCQPEVAQVIREAVAEYEAARTREAVVARDADKLECLIQAVEYQRQGWQTVQPWIDSNRAALRTPSALRLAEAVLTTGTLDWLPGPTPRPGHSPGSASDTS